MKYLLVVVIGVFATSCVPKEEYDELLAENRRLESLIKSKDNAIDLHRKVIRDNEGLIVQKRVRIEFLEEQLKQFIADEITGITYHASDAVTNFINYKEWYDPYEKLRNVKAKKLTPGVFSISFEYISDDLPSYARNWKHHIATLTFNNDQTFKVEYNR